MTSNFFLASRTTNSILAGDLKHDLLVIIGLLTIMIFILLVLWEIYLKLRQVYRTSEPILPHYQSLVKSNGNLCQCLPKFECVRSNCQISNRYVNYEQINERQKSNSISRACRIHIGK